MREYRWGEDYRERMDMAVAGKFRGFFEGNEGTRTPLEPPVEWPPKWPYDDTEFKRIRNELDLLYDDDWRRYLEDLRTNINWKDVEEESKRQALAKFAKTVQLVDYLVRAAKASGKPYLLPVWIRDVVVAGSLDI